MFLVQKRRVRTSHVAVADCLAGSIYCVVLTRRRVPAQKARPRKFSSNRPGQGAFKERCENFGMGPKNGKRPKFLDPVTDELKYIIFPFMNEKDL